MHLSQIDIVMSPIKIFKFMIVFYFKILNNINVVVSSHGGLGRYNTVSHL